MWVKRWTTLGERNEIGAGTVLASDPLDKNFKGGRSYLRIGHGNIIREHFTISRGTRPESETVIGDENYIMTSGHVAHNCVIGNRTVLASCSLMAGYVEVEDQAFVSGNVAAHQYSKIGRLAMVGGGTRVNKDVPPYFLYAGLYVTPVGLNLVGLKRAGFAREDVTALKNAYRLLYRSGLKLADALARIETEIPHGAHAAPGSLHPREQTRHLPRNPPSQSAAARITLSVTKLEIHGARIWRARPLSCRHGETGLGNDRVGEGKHRRAPAPIGSGQRTFPTPMARAGNQRVWRLSGDVRGAGAGCVSPAWLCGPSGRRAADLARPGNRHRAVRRSFRRSLEPSPDDDPERCVALRSGFAAGSRARAGPKFAACEFGACEFGACGTLRDLLRHRMRFGILHPGARCDHPRRRGARGASRRQRGHAANLAVGAHCEPWCGRRPGGALHENACFVADAASFIVSALLVTTISVNMPRTSRPQRLGEHQAARVLLDMRAGAAFLFQHAELSGATLAMVAGTFATGCFSSLAAVYVRDVLHVGMSFYGALGSLIAAGMLAGSLCVGRLARQASKETSRETSRDTSEKR